MKIIGKIFYALFVILLVSVAGLFLASLLPIPGNIEVKIVKSGSMEPTMQTGSVIIVKPQAMYAVGDVITFGEDSTAQIPTTHRIISIRAEGARVYFLTKGDANEEADPTEVESSAVIGKVFVDVPYAGYILDFAKQPLGFTFLIGIPAGIIIIDESARIVKEIASLKRRRQASQENESRQET